MEYTFLTFSESSLLYSNMKVSFLPTTSMLSLNLISPSGVLHSSVFSLFVVVSSLTSCTFLIPNIPCKNSLKESDVLAPTVIPVAQTTTIAKLTAAHFIFLIFINLPLLSSLDTLICWLSNSFFQFSGVLIVSNFFKFIFASNLRFFWL